MTSSPAPETQTFRVRAADDARDIVNLADSGELTIADDATPDELRRAIRDMAKVVPRSRPASNAPTKVRRFGNLATWARRWLGITDQRRDFDALGMTLSVKDQVVDGIRRDMDAQSDVLRQVVEQLNRTTNGAVNTQERLTWYEKRVPVIAGARKSYDLAVKRETKRREQYVLEHPELSSEAKDSMLRTGSLPTTAGENGAAPTTPAA